MSEISPRAGLPKKSSRFMFLSVLCFLFVFFFTLPRPPLSRLRGSRPQNGSMILYNRKKVKYRKDGYCWKKRKDGKTTREDHMKLKVQGVEVSLPVLGFQGNEREPGRVWAGVGWGREEATLTLTQTNTGLIVPSLGCNGDSHMLQPACVSKESYQETMQHNNSFPSEASGVEPIVCTLLKRWMLPLLQRAYINLAGSKQQCAASIPSPHLTLLCSQPLPYHCHKQTRCTHAFIIHALI